MHVNIFLTMYNLKIILNKMTLKFHIFRKLTKHIRKMFYDLIDFIKYYTSCYSSKFDAIRKKFYAIPYTFFAKF